MLALIELLKLLVYTRTCFDKEIKTIQIKKKKASYMKQHVE